MHLLLCALRYTARVLKSIRITSLDDPRVAEYRNVRDADLRGGGGFSAAGPGGSSNKLFMAESEPVIRRLIESKRFAVKSMFVSDDRLESMRNLVMCFAANGAGAVYVADIEVMRAIAGYRHHGGALAVGIRPQWEDLQPQRIISSLTGLDRFCMLLVEGVTHVDNIGAIFRNAAAFGADGIILDSACADPLFRKAIRVSMGQVFHVNWAMADDLRETSRMLRERCGATIVAAESRDNSIAIERFALPSRCAIVLGAERQGIPDATLALADHIVGIPMARSDTSLNVAVASAVFLHEWRRSNAEST